MGLATLVSRRRGSPEDRTQQLSWPDYLRLWEQFGFNGVQYVVPGGNLSELSAQQAQRNPIVWACIALRLMVFSEVRFAYQGWAAGRPGQLSGTGSQGLSLLERPWTQASTGDLLARMSLDADLYGNSYWTAPDNAPGQLVRLDPTRVEIATTDVVDNVTGNVIGKRLIGYLVNDSRGQMVAVLLADEVAHFRPIPDPGHEFRGISWMNALLPDIVADSDMSDFKHAFLQNAATPSLVVQFAQGASREAMNAFRDKMESAHTGPQAGFKTLYLGAGADVKVVGSNFQQLNINEVQSAGETRIASAAGVPPSLLSLSEGLKGSALNAGNYAATRRRFSDGTMRPLWRSAAGALSTIAPPPTGKRLWYDERDVPFLQADLADRADAQQKDASTIATLINAGFEPDSVVDAVVDGDFNRLVHTGLVSVQLQPPGTTIPDPDNPAPAPTPAPTLPAAA